MLMKDIDFLIIGAAKSATTWLQRSLQADPAVSMPGPELHYFSREFSRGNDWYLAQFPNRGEAVVTGEKSNSYLESVEAVDRIKAALPRAKLIAQLRNPVERAYSDYCMLFRRGEVNGDIERHLDPGQGQANRFIDGGNYFRQLRAYYDRFPDENILVTFYETINVAPETQLVEVRRFLGLPAEHAESFVQTKAKDKTVPMLSPTWRRTLGPLKPIVKPLRGNPLFKKVHASLATEIKYPRLRRELRQRLASHYAPEVEALGKLVGRNLSGWLNNVVPSYGDPAGAAKESDTVQPNNLVRVNEGV
jgi:hypothetical protein